MFLVFRNLPSWIRSIVRVVRPRPDRHRAQPRIRPKKQRRSPTRPTQCPRLQAIWLRLIDQYFPERADLASYTVAWSARPQRRVLATCFPRRRRVKVARELEPLAFDSWLEPLLYHELCHAVLGERHHASGRRDMHGAAFKHLEARHPGTRELDQWIQLGGWSSCVRSDRARRAAQRRRAGS